MKNNKTNWKYNSIKAKQNEKQQNKLEITKQIGIYNSIKQIKNINVKKNKTNWKYNSIKSKTNCKTTKQIEIYNSIKQNKLNI